MMIELEISLEVVTGPPPSTLSKSSTKQGTKASDPVTVCKLCARGGMFPRNNKLDCPSRKSLLKLDSDALPVTDNASEKEKLLLQRTS